MRSLSAPASGEALPMEQEFKQGYRMHRVLSNLNRLDVDRLDDADRERVETASKPYTEAAFFHFKATGSLQRHRAYHAAYESDAFTVVFEADYATGYQTITVEDERCFRQCLSSAGDGCRRTPE